MTVVGTDQDTQRKSGKDALQSNAATKPTSRSASTRRNRQRTVLHLFPGGDRCIPGAV